MSPTSTSLLYICLGAAVAASTFAAWAWARNRRFRWLVRPALLTLCSLTALAVVGVLVNRILFLYPTWDALLGQDAKAAAAPPVPRDDDGVPIAAKPGASRMDVFNPPVGKSGVSLPVYVYLPPGYDQSPNMRYPVITAYSGFPGTPQTWIISEVQAQATLDKEIREHRMAPTIVIWPVHHPDPKIDSQCVDAVGGPQFETYLTVDVRNAVISRYRARTEAAAWGIIGFSLGGYCAVNHTMRHPDKYRVAASLAGYFTTMPGGPGGNQDLFRGNEQLRKEHAPLWRIQNLPVPDMDLWYGAPLDDTRSVSNIREFGALVKAPMRLTTEFIPKGGHTLAPWVILIPGAFDWMSSRLAAPQTLS
ncbi:alpha/beta hydrolase [Longispora albida]|uniref:alpha/beta hydrolase n=1 Tax=Longispora albida TaxID=203523 RepID=UPI00037920FC|nr:alpha/beta hydrolase-fold protein [Longispora albida]